MTPVVRARVLVSGGVQGVFYRASAHQRAVELGLSGWVRNLPEGRVEAVLEGPEADVDAMIAWCREGTPLSRVERVEVERGAPEGLTGFRIAH
ncbi:MAG TPA: acylphosphatase [Actinomycetota bacterium]